MYHKPKMCRTCLQMSRGDFKFVTLDSVDPLWESNSPNLKEQLLTLVPEMKLDGSEDVICTSCFIALRTGYEFKKMCQLTESKFQNHNYKYRRPFGVGPGSAQFHVTLNENHKNEKNGDFNCQNINFLQADTSIDITEHHLYDASKPTTRKSILNSSLTDNLPEVTLETIESKKPTDSAPTATECAKPKEIKRPQMARKKVTSFDIRKKYKIGNEISIMKSDKNSAKNDLLVQAACETVDYLKENQIKPDALVCFVKCLTLTKASVNESISYYFDELNDSLPCITCNQTFRTRYKLSVHQIEEHDSQQIFACTQCEKVFVNSSNLEKHVSEGHVKAIESSVAARVENAIVVDLEKEDGVKADEEKKVEVSEGAKPAVKSLEEEDKSAKNDVAKGVSEESKPDNVDDKKALSPGKKEIKRLSPNSPRVKRLGNKLLNEDELEDLLQNDGIEDQLLEGDLQLDTVLVEKKKIETLADKTAASEPTTATKATAASESTSITPVDTKEPNESDDDGMDVDLGFGAADQDDSDDDSAPEPSKENSVKKTPESEEKPVEKTPIVNSAKPEKLSGFWYRKVRYTRCLICKRVCHSQIQLMQHCSAVHVPRVFCTFSSSTANLIADLKKQTKLETETEPKLKTEPKIKTEAKMATETKIAAEPKIATEPKMAPEPKIKLEPKTATDPKMTAEPKLKTKLEIKTEPGLIIEPEKHSVADKIIEESELLSRTRVKPPPAVTKCNICDKVINSYECMDIHMYIHIPYIMPNEFEEEPPDYYSCYLCPKKFPKERFLKLHNKQVHLSKKVVCSKCKREFRSHFWYENHKCQIAVEVPHDLASDPANDLASESTCNSARGDAPIINFPTSPPFYCALCDRTFARLRFLKSHTARIHNRKKPKPEIVEYNLDDELKLYKVDDSEDLFNPSNSVEVVMRDDVTSEEEYEPDDDEFDAAISSAEEDQDERPDSPASSLPDAEAAFLKSSASNYKRKSTDRMPKIQCDFCGAMIDENRYDNHIYEHNKVRLQKSRKSDAMLEVAEAPPDPENGKATLKCQFCPKLFQRQYHLTNHIKKHLSGELGEVTPEMAQQAEALEIIPLEPVNQENMDVLEKPKEIHECCGRTFKLKANLYRHISMAHPELYPKRRVKRLPKEEKFEMCEDDDERRYKRRRSLPPMKNEDSTATSDTDDSTITVKSRKRTSLPEGTTIQRVRKRKLTVTDTLEDTREILKRAKIENEIDVIPIRNVTSPDKLSDPEYEKLFKFKCNFCNKSFKQSCQLRDHSNVHTGDRPYTCYFCEPSRGFTQTSSLYVHYRRVHAAIVENCTWEAYSKTGNCLTCGEIFEKHVLMYQHAKDNYRKYTCEICDQDQTMGCHYIVHNLEPRVVKVEQPDEPSSVEVVNVPLPRPKPRQPAIIKCDDCDKTFTKKRELRFHKKSLAHIQQVQGHKDEDASDTLIEGLANSVDSIIKTLKVMKRHHCTLCGANFVRKIQLKKHKRKMHRKKRGVVKKEVANEGESVEEKPRKVVARRKTTDVAGARVIAADESFCTIEASINAVVDSSVDAVVDARVGAFVASVGAAGTSLDEDDTTKKIRKIRKRRKTIDVSELLKSATKPTPSLEASDPSERLSEDQSVKTVTNDELKEELANDQLKEKEEVANDQPNEKEEVANDQLKDEEVTNDQLQETEEVTNDELQETKEVTNDQLEEKEEFTSEQLKDEEVADKQVNEVTSDQPKEEEEQEEITNKETLPEIVHAEPTDTTATDNQVESSSVVDDKVLNNSVSEPSLVCNNESENRTDEQMTVDV